MLRQIDATTYRNQFSTHAEAALKHALDIRKFEIDLYWKRATYFWLLNGAAFAGYFAAANASNPHRDILFTIACVGLVLSFAWYFVNRGSRQWQDNWEYHVDMLEDCVTGPLYKTVLRASPSNALVKHAVTGAGNFSVSKINIIVSAFVIVIWVLLILNNLIPLSVTIPLYYILVMVITILTIMAMLRWGKTSDDDNIGLEAKLRTTTISGGMSPAAENPTLKDA
jgi:hypothetical protein